MFGILQDLLCHQRIVPNTGQCLGVLERIVEYSEGVWCKLQPQLVQRKQDYQDNQNWNPKAEATIQAI